MFTVLFCTRFPNNIDDIWSRNEEREKDKKMEINRHTQSAHLVEIDKKAQFY